MNKEKNVSFIIDGQAGFKLALKPRIEIKPGEIKSGGTKPLCDIYGTGVCSNIKQNIPVKYQINTVYANGTKITGSENDGLALIVKQPAAGSRYKDCAFELKRKTFVNKEEQSGSASNFNIDPFDVDSFGKGTLQLSIRPVWDDIYPNSETVAFADNPLLAFDFPVGIDIFQMDGKKELPITDASVILIGDTILVKPKVHPVFSGLKLLIDVFESDIGEGEDKSDDDEETLFHFEWDINATGIYESAQWEIGRSKYAALGYDKELEKDTKLEFVVKASLQKNDGKTDIKKSIALCQLPTIALPVLTSFELVKTEDNCFKVQGELKGFSSSMSVPLQMEMYVADKSEENKIINIEPASYFLKVIAPVYTLGTKFQDGMHVFEDDVFDYAALNDSERATLSSKLFFAVLRVSKGTATEYQNFGNIIDYKVNERDDGDDTGFAPFGATSFASKVFSGTGVCSNGITLDGVVKTIEDLGVSLAEAKVRAFLRAIRVGEGTTGEDGYEKIFGGKSFIKHYGKDWNDHPQITITSGNYTSSAAGAYQIVNATWESKMLNKYKDKYNIKSFTPENQDKAAFLLLKYKRETLTRNEPKYKNAYGDIIQMLIDDELDRAILTASLEWASIPGSPYGQPMQKSEDFKKYYELFLDLELKRETTLHVEYGWLKELGYKLD